MGKMNSEEEEATSSVSSPSKQKEVTVDPNASANATIPSCCVYSFELLIMGGETA